MNVEEIVKKYGRPGDASHVQAINRYNAQKNEQERQAVANSNAAKFGFQGVTPEIIKAIQVLMSGGQFAPGSIPGSVQLVQPPQGGRGQGSEWDINETTVPPAVAPAVVEELPAPSQEELARIDAMLGVQARMPAPPVEETESAAETTMVVYDEPCSYCGKNGQPTEVYQTGRMVRFVCEPCKTRASIKMFDSILKAKPKKRVSKPKEE